MDVLFAIFWKVVIHDEFNIFDVETSTGDVGGYQYRVRLSEFELTEDPISFFLSFIAMNPERRPRIASQPSR